MEQKGAGGGFRILLLFIMRLLSVAAFALGKEFLEITENTIVNGDCGE